ncbi:hypothetical protein [Novosphingobium sp.]|uniref:hypothetical protein n=1 Tax=Novosphingobium sp. TaxID=1874826 RepID=UPI003BA88300
MTSLFDLFASIALVLPGFPADEAVFAPPAGEVSAEDEWDAAALPAGSILLANPQAPGATAAGINPLAPDVWDQERIEQRVIIRVTPRDAGRDALAPQILPLQSMQPIVQPLVPQPRSTSVRVRERKAGKCMPAMGIAAVQPITDGRLMFYMRDRRMLAAGLEKACSARDFYLGFYMSKTADGQLCVGRDAIHSRAGTTCKLKDVREYVPVDGN